MIAPSRSVLGLLLVLMLALLVRMAPAIWAPTDTPQQVEMADVASNLASGKGFFLDLKTNYVVSTPVVHFAGDQYPVLPLDLVAVASRVVGPAAAPRLVSIVLFLVALAIFDALLRRRIGPETAFMTGLLLALSPALLAATLASPVTAAMLAALAFIIWAGCGEHSAMLTGLACAIGFVTHPALGVLAPVLAAPILRDAVCERRAKPFLLFIVCCLTGPAWLWIFNRTMGVPGSTMAQAWLYRVVSESDGQRLLQQGHIYESAWTLLGAEGAAVANLIGARAWNLLKELAALRGLAMVLPLLPVAAIGMAQARPLRGFLWLAPLALALLTLDAVTWSRAGVTCLAPLGESLLLTLVVIGTLETLGREPLRQHPKARLSPAGFALLAVALVWLAMDARLGQSAWRGSRSRAAAAQDAARTASSLGAALQAQVMDNPHAILATHEPWRLHEASGLPTMLLPYDLEGAAWGRLLDRMAASLVAVDRATWPAVHKAALRDLTSSLAEAGWQTAFTTGTLRVWRRTSF